LQKRPIILRSLLIVATPQHLYLSRRYSWSKRLVGFLKLHVSLENVGLFCRALLQKRPIILRSLLIVATTQHLYLSRRYSWSKPPFSSTLRAMYCSPPLPGVAVVDLLNLLLPILPAPPLTTLAHACFLKRALLFRLLFCTCALSGQDMEQIRAM